MTLRLLSCSGLRRKPKDGDARSDSGAGMPFPASFLEAEVTEPWCVIGRNAARDCKHFLEAPRQGLLPSPSWLCGMQMHCRSDGCETIEVTA